MQPTELTWKDIVVEALRSLGGEAHLRDINAAVEDHPKTATNPTWRDTIRRVVRQYTVFQPVPPERSGVYRLVDIVPPPLGPQGLDNPSLTCYADLTHRSKDSIGEVIQVQQDTPIVVRCIPIRQHKQDLLVGAIKAGDLLGIAKLDVYRREPDGEERGYQRLPERPRARSIGRFLTVQKECMPPAVILSYRGDASPLLHEVYSGFAEFRLDRDQCLWIVDGQHRSEGLRVAIEEMGADELNDFDVPVVVLVGVDEVDEAQQFRVINESAKKVRTDLARRLLVMAAKTRGHSSVIKEDRLWEVKVSEVLDSLLKLPGSPWAGFVQRPNEKRTPTHVVKELSFTQSLKPIVRTFPWKTWDADKLAAALAEYWKAWQELCPEAFEDPKRYVLLKTPGVFSLHGLALGVFDLLRSRGVDLSKKEFLPILRDLGEYAEPIFWDGETIEGASAYGSMKGFGILTDLMVDRLTDAGYQIGA